MQFRGRMWDGWEEEIRDAYEMGGKALGKFLLENPEQEPLIWDLVGRHSGWPRKWLRGFRQMYKRENPDAARVFLHNKKMRNYVRRQSCAKKSQSEQDALKRATDEVGSALRKRRL